MTEIELITIANDKLAFAIQVRDGVLNKISALEKEREQAIAASLDDADAYDLLAVLRQQITDANAELQDATAFVDAARVRVAEAEKAVADAEVAERREKAKAVALKVSRASARGARAVNLLLACLKEIQEGGREIARLVPGQAPLAHRLANPRAMSPAVLGTRRGDGKMLADFLDAPRPTFRGAENLDSYVKAILKNIGV